MAAARHLKALIRAYRDRDDLAFRRAAQAIIEEEEAKRHTTLARDLRILLAAGSGGVASDGGGPLSAPNSAHALPEPPRDRDSAMPLAEVTNSTTRLADLVLDEDLHRELVDLVSEIDHWSLLDRHGIPRRNRLLLYGPPGCGKTSIASALAAELSRPLVTVRVESVVSSFLGETASNLRKVIEFASSGAFVVLFDEFDSLGKDREDPNDHGELRRVVNAVLQLIDTYRGPSLLVAATNHAAVIDEAMWRRFDEVLQVGPPTRDQVEMVLRQLLGRTSIKGNVLAHAADQLAGAPHAAAAHAANSARRSAVLRGETYPTATDLQHGVNTAHRRRWV